MQDKDLDILNMIQKVEPSEFLLTRIKAKIDKEIEPYISPAWAYSLAAIMLIVFALNIVSVTKMNGDSGNSSELDISAYETSNSLYYE